MSAHYVIALGSNQRHAQYGSPQNILRVALAQLDTLPLILVDHAPLIASLPLGPSRRRYANSAALVSSALDPPSLLEHLKALERQFGNRRAGQRWRARVLDLDIILWSGGIWASTGLAIPHPRFRQRRFVIEPLYRLCPAWPDPVSHRTIRHLHARLDRRRRSA